MKMESEPIRIDFEYTATEWQEAQRAVARRAYPMVGVVRWVQFFAVVTVASVFLYGQFVRRNETPVAAPTPIPLSFHRAIEILPVVVPWLLIFGLVWFFAFRQLRNNRRRENPILGRLHQMEVNQSGVTVTTTSGRREFHWSAFHAWQETAHLFLLYDADPKRASVISAEVIPKRAIRNSADLDALRHLIASNVRAHDSAFPVLPPRQV